MYQQLSSNYQWLQIKTPKIPYMDHWLQRDGWFQLVVDKVENTFTSRQDLPLDSDFFWPKSHFWIFLDIPNPISSHCSKHWCSKAHVFPRLFRFLILFATLQSHGVHYYPQGVGHLQVTGKNVWISTMIIGWYLWGHSLVTYILIYICIYIYVYIYILYMYINIYGNHT